jgi:hypothetical protein
MTFQKPNNTAVSFGFSALPHPITRPPAQLPAQICYEKSRVKVYSAASNPIYMGAGKSQCFLLLLRSLAKSDHYSSVGTIYG